MNPTPRQSNSISAQSLVSFLLVGAAATALQYIVMFGLHAGAGVAALPASAIGFCASAAFNYACNAAFTFRSNQPHHQAIPRFAVTAAAGLAINSLLLSLLITLGLPLVPAQVLTTVGVLSWNYCINAIWTFKKRSA
jgi:putative flippase GtrA